MNSSTSKDFLLILSFPGYLKHPSIISSLLPLAISLCSEVRRALSPHKRRGHQDASKRQGRNVSMVPSSMSVGQQYKISPPETEPPLTPLLTSSILPPVLSHITILDLPDMLTQIEEWG